MAFAVRKAAPADALLLAEMGRRTFFDTFGAENDPTDMQTYLDSAFGVDIQAAELADARGTFLVAESDGLPVGYARLRTSTPPNEVEALRPIELVRFYVERGAQGLGYGGLLMKAVVALAERDRHDAIWLSVWERNSKGIGFYERQGFSAAGRLTFVLGEDVQRDLLMVRRLGASER